MCVCFFKTYFTATTATNHYYTGYDPVGWGLPYGSFVATDTAKPLMESAVQVCYDAGQDSQSVCRM